MIYRAYIAIAVVLIYGCTSSGSQKQDPTTAMAMETMLDTTVFNFGEPVTITAAATADTVAVLKCRMSDKEITIDTLGSPNTIHQVAIVDFDKNGSSDILLSYFANNPLHELYLYDST